MCSNRNEIIASIRNEAFRMTDELFEDKNLDEIDQSELQQFSSKIVNFVSMRMAEEFRDENHGDSSDIAQEERRIHMDIANHINNQHISNNRMIDFYGSSFQFFIREL